MAETLERTRFIMGAMLGTLKDCGHKPEHVREVLREWGFILAPKFDAGELEYLSWVTPPPGVSASDACLHEETERLGAIWTRCTQCGLKWADDDPKNPLRTRGAEQQR